jgi:DNA gyrase subunit A
MTRPEDEVFAITSAGGVIRTRAGEVKLSGRQTMGVRLMNLGPGDSVVAIARNAESLEESDEDEVPTDEASEDASVQVPEQIAEQGNDTTDGDVL